MGCAGIYGIKEIYRTVCGYASSERKKNTDLGELLGLEPVSVVNNRIH